MLSWAHVDFAWSNLMMKRGTCGSWTSETLRVKQLCRMKRLVLAVVSVQLQPVLSSDCHACAEHANTRPCSAAAQRCESHEQTSGGGFHTHTHTHTHMREEKYSTTTLTITVTESKHCHTYTHTHTHSLTHTQRHSGSILTIIFLLREKWYLWGFPVMF